MDDDDSFDDAMGDDAPSSVILSEPGVVGSALQKIIDGVIPDPREDLTEDEQEWLKFAQLTTWQRTLIAALRVKGNIGLACRAAGVSPRTYAKYRESCPEFKELCDDALTFNDDLVESRAYQLGVEGYFEPVFQGGLMVGRKRVFSERLLEIMLKARRPEKFSPDKKLTLQLPPGTGKSSIPTDQVAELVRQLSPTLAAGVLASRPKIIDVQSQVIEPA
jgi:hypothetical protein